MLTTAAKNKIKMLEKLRLKMIEPRSNSYQKRLSVLQLTPIESFIDKLFTEYMHQVNNPGHCLRRLLPVSAATHSYTTRHGECPSSREDNSAE